MPLLTSNFAQQISTNMEFSFNWFYSFGPSNVSALPGETWTPEIVSFQSCKRLENDTALACYTFDTHQPILKFFVDNKVVLLVSCANIISRLDIFL